MGFTVSTRVRIKGKHVVVQRTTDSGDRAAHAAAIREVGEEARKLSRANEVANKSSRQGYRKRKKPDA